MWIALNPASGPHCLAMQLIQLQQLVLGFRSGLLSVSQPVESAILCTLLDRPCHQTCATSSARLLPLRVVAVSPTCAGLPAASVANGAFPSTCANAAVGSSCKATCNTGFNGSPAVACVADPNAPTRGSWSMTVNGTCTPGEASTGGTLGISAKATALQKLCMACSTSSLMQPTPCVNS